MSARSVAVQALDLTPLVHPREPGEWHYRPPGALVPSCLPAVTAFDGPDSAGVCLYFDQTRWLPEQLDGLIAFLVAVQAAQTAGEAS